MRSALKKLGLAVVVLTPGHKPGQQATEAVIDLVVGISENVITNRGRSGSQKPAIAAVEAAMASLMSWSPSDEWTPLKWLGSELLATEPLAYQVTFETRTFLTVIP